MYKFIATVIVIFGVFCNGITGTFTKISSHHYNYTGAIESKDVLELVNLKKVNLRELTITINSNGGAYEPGLTLGKFTRDNKIKIIVDDARSSAGLWALGDRKYTYLTGESFILLHLPYNLKEDNPSPEIWMPDGARMYLFFTEVAGWSKNKTLYTMDTMTDLRKTYGIRAGVMIKKDGTYPVYSKPEVPASPPPLLSFLLFPGGVIPSQRI
jgi:hypothetical protein